MESTDIRNCRYHIALQRYIHTCTVVKDVERKDQKVIL